MKYKEGDYIAAAETIAIKIVAYLEGEEPLYALYHHQSSDDEIKWFSEYELDNLGFKKFVPNTKLWNGVKQGDMIKAGNAAKKVLARVGNAVLLSSAPMPHDQIKTGRNLMEQLDRLTGNTTLAEKYDKGHEQMKPFITTSGAMRVAEDHWHSVEELALNNWELLRE